MSAAVVGFACSGTGWFREHALPRVRDGSGEPPESARYF